MVENAFGKTSEKLKRIFSKENTIAIIDHDESEEIKTALQVRIQGIVKDKDVDFYLVHAWLVYDSKRSSQIKKRYSNFLELKESLANQGYDNLPNIPPKKLGIFFSDEDKRERRAGLELFIKALVNRKDTRNSVHLIKFLDLQNFCPEIIFNVPQLLIKKQYNKGK